MIILLILDILIPAIKADYSKKVSKFTGTELNILILGDFGKTESESTIKMNVVRQSQIVILHLLQRNEENKYNLAILLGDNCYPLGLRRGDFSPMQKIFADSFPETHFKIDFLSVLGNHGYYGDVETFITYFHHEPRYYQPDRYYLYSRGYAPILAVYLETTVIQFVCVDSTPLVEQWMQQAFCLDDQVQKKAVREMIRDSKDADYMFLVAHHPPMTAFGPHAENSNDNFLNQLLQEFEFTAAFSGHNHNVQYVPKHGQWKTAQIILGSSAKLSRTTVDKTNGEGWYNDKTGAFGHLRITKNHATLEFVDEQGVLLKTVRMNPRTR
ncbi:Purple acid phosphatase 7 [Thelohanellus kitauei]|uniref:Purple acid phosphatase 7 n=1 Tax=Thelohanellus kitauei TaxID=669202 RepID=A0A0C2MQ63_THEKT|nr:Purple acid phosphatase 7 [Thelohanellus kitauei]